MVSIDMEQDGSMRRPLVVAGVGVLVVAVATGLSLWHDRAFWDAPPSAPTAASAPAHTAPPAAAVAERPRLSRLPAFDVVRVQPDGDAVIAGRGLPGQSVTIMSGDSPLGEVTADADGEWVFVPETPLAPGTHRLTLTAPDGAGTVQSDDEVVVVIARPEGDAAGGTSTMAIRTSRSGTGPTAVLQSPFGADAAQLAIEAVDDDGRGRLSLSGRAAPQSRVQLYLDNRYLGDTIADGLGVWRFAPPSPLPAGRYELRADQMNSRGKVAARSHVPLLVGLPAGGEAHKVVVERGQSLWRIARAVYGEGMAYTLIYAANRAEIDDPDRIFPGQVFQLPASR